VDDGRPLRHFPGNYSIKAVGRDQDEFAVHAESIVKSVIEAKASISHTLRKSKQGAYISVTLDFTARDQEELDKVFTTMHADQRVLWVL